jgi:hypothetical protein
MMGNEDFGESRQVNHTPAIALGVAAVLLLIVGAMSYRDSVRSSMEREYAEKERQLLMRHGYPVNPYPNMQQPLQSQYAPNGYPQQGQLPQQGQQPAYQNQFPQQNYPQQPQNNQAIARNAANMNVESNLPAPNDPEIAAIENSLDQVREQERLTEQRYRDITSGVDTLAREADVAASEITEELPDFLRNAVESPPGGNPLEEAELARMRERVKVAPTLASVTSVNLEFGFITFNAGMTQNVRKDQKYAIRRSGEIVGWVRVDEVQENDSVAMLESEHNEATIEVKPEVGDDLIPFDSF